MFCTNCGNQLNEGAKFCGNCGTQIDAKNGAFNAGAVEVPGNVQAPIPQHRGDTGDEEVLIEWILNSSNFSITSINGNCILAADAFKQSDAAATVAGALLGAAVGIAASQWSIKVQIMKSSIRFTRLNMLLRPTKSRIEIDMDEIRAVTMPEKVSFLNKNDITLCTKSRGDFALTTPKKKKDEIINLLRELTGNNY